MLFPMLLPQLRKLLEVVEVSLVLQVSPPHSVTGSARGISPFTKQEPQRRPEHTCPGSPSAGHPRPAWRTHVSQEMRDPSCSCLFSVTTDQGLLLKYNKCLVQRHFGSFPFASIPLEAWLNESGSSGHTGTIILTCVTKVTC